MSALTPQDMRAYFWRRPWVQVLNSSDADTIPPFSVVLITTATLTTNGDIRYTIRQPNAASTDFNWNGYLVTGPFKISSGGQGIATNLCEPGFLRYDTGTPAVGQVWGPKHGQYTASRYYYGFEIVGGNTTTPLGNTITCARWIGIPGVLGKTDGASTKGSGTVTVSVWNGAVNSDADTTMNIASVGNEFANVASGKYVWVTRNGETPYLTSAECA